MDSVCDNFLKKEKIKLTGKYQDVVVIHSSKGEELLDDVDVNQFNITEVQEITLKIEDLQEDEEQNKDNEEENKEKEEPRGVTMRDLGYEEDITSELDEPILDVVRVSFGDKTAEDEEEIDETIMDVVKVSFEDKPDEKMDEPIMDVVTVSFDDKTVKETTGEQSDEVIMDVVKVSFDDKPAEENYQPITVVTVSFGDKVTEDENNEEDNREITTTLVTWGQEIEEKCDVDETDGIQDSNIKVNEDLKITRDELDEFEKDEDSDLTKSVSTSSFHSLSEEVKLIIF